MEDFLSSFHVEQLRCVVHRARGYKHAVGIEREADDFHLVALERVVALARVGVPDLGGAVEGPRDDLVAVRVVERHRVHHVAVLLERDELAAALGVPHLAGPVVRPRDELIARFVESAVSERQEMSPEYLVKSELLFSVL